MSTNKEEKGQVAADRIKQAALSAAKGLSRAQAERAATAAARNVNAYGQKEEGPSRWQERKEAKRQMYLMSTEKAVKLGERKDQKALVTSIAGPTQCQKCFQPGHWTYECKNERVYITRPSRSQILRNPKLKLMTPVSFEGNPDYEREKEKERGKKEENGEKSQRKEKDKKKGKNSKRKHRSRSNSDDTSEASVFESDSESSVTGSEYSSDESSSSYSSSDSEDRKRKRKKRQRKRRHRSYSSSSDYSDSESASDSDSAGRASQRKSRRHNRGR